MDKLVQKSFNYVVYVEPKPKKRPKVYRFATVNPSEKDEKKLAQEFIKLDNIPKKPLAGQLIVYFKFYKNPPKNTPKWQYELMEKGIIRPNKSPDLDNYVKLALDALNGLLWEDDRFIIETYAGKYYTTGKPKIEIKLEYIPQLKNKKEAEAFIEKLENQNLETFLNT